MKAVWLLSAVLSLGALMVASQDGDIERDTVVCSPLPAPANGLLSGCHKEGQSLPLGDGQPLGSSCGLSCDDGFALVGSASRTCLADGTWDGTPGSCEVDPCVGYTCKKPNYAICVPEEIDGKLQPVCDCPSTCPDVIQPVCSVYGKQYDSLCHLRLYACKRRRQYPLAYKAPCIASQERCTRDQLAEFPHRLLEWFLHLREIDELQRLDPNNSIRKLDVTARRKLAKWKFDLLDRKHDGILDRRDLREFRYGLMPLEHCADDFFHECYAGSRSVTVEQWNQCLKVEQMDEAPAREDEPQDPPRSMGGFFLNVVTKEEAAAADQEDDA